MLAQPVSSSFLLLAWLLESESVRNINGEGHWNYPSQSFVFSSTFFKRFHRVWRALQLFLPSNYSFFRWSMRQSLARGASGHFLLKWSDLTHIWTRRALYLNYFFVIVCFNTCLVCVIVRLLLHMSHDPDEPHELTECLKNYGWRLMTLYRQWTKPSPRKRNEKKAKWLSEEPLQLAVKREVKGKGEKERYTH